jgi:flagellin
MGFPGKMLVVFEEDAKMAGINSVASNPSALVALQNLNKITQSLATAQNRVSTGLKISSALDNGASFAIAQGIRGELKAITAVTQGLDNAKGVGKVALAGTTSVSDLLGDIRSKLTELSNAGVTTSQRALLSEDFNDLLTQAGDFITSAVFNGINLIDGTTTSITVLSNLTGGTLTVGASYNLASDTTSLAGVSVGSASSSLAVITSQFATLESSVNAALGGLGADVNSLEFQSSFLAAISDATEEGLAGIVDADMAREAARLTALQVQQQLAVQTLGIVNQAPLSLLSLFR